MANRHYLTRGRVAHQVIGPRSVFWLMDPDKLAEYLDREATYYRSLADYYREIAAAKDRGDYRTGPQTQSIRIAAEAGIRLTDALGEWAEWTRCHPPASSESPETWPTASAATES
ncbi:hypothetical protein ACWEO2_13380 [Nocardia sp. NPDC004278]